MSSQAFLRSMFASEEESESESLLASESLDELSFFFFFFFDTFFCFLAFFAFSFYPHRCRNHHYLPFSIS